MSSVLEPISKDLRLEITLSCCRREAYANGHLPGANHYSVYGINTYDTDPAPLASFAKMLGTKSMSQTSGF